MAALPPCVMLAKDHPKAAQPSLTLAELAGEAMTLLDLPLSREYFLSLFHDCGLRPNITARTSDMSMVRSLVANGFGFGLVNMRTRSDLAPNGEKLVTLPLTGPVRPVALGLATKRSDHRFGIVAAFFRHAKDHLHDTGLLGLDDPHESPVASRSRSASSIRSHLASWSRLTNSSGRCPCAMDPGPQTTVGIPSCVENKPPSVPKATLIVACHRSGM
ncbi:hypothetical protein GLR48_01560 [Loktanella sp. M215]|nr:hypothetical protein [Loktanella sp. M215]